MKKFLVLYNVPSEKMKQSMENNTPEDHKKSMEEWMKWMEENKAYFVDSGAPAGKNSRVSQDFVTEEPNEVGGYSIMQAESKEELIKVIQTGPHLAWDGAYVEVMELMAM